jgi:ribosomal protein S18 acetylase RimI-like enzyme
MTARDPRSEGPRRARSKALLVLNDFSNLKTYQSYSMCGLQPRNTNLMVLATQISNTSAQKLYEARGYIRDEEFHHYALRLR